MNLKNLNFSRSAIFLSSLLLVMQLVACGGGSDGAAVDTSVPGGGSTINATTKAQSNAILIDYLNTANARKYENFTVAANQNRQQYATSIGARVTGNGVLNTANSLSFKTQVDSFLSGFILKINEISSTYPIDASTLVNELTLYQTNDVAYISNLLANAGGSSTAVVSDINNEYQRAKQSVLTYQ